MPDDASPTGLFTVRVQRIEWEAEGVVSVELLAAAGAALPPFTAGSHIDLNLAPGLVRSYSLTNLQGETHRYVIAVGLDAASEGGSRFVHQQLRVGQMLQITAPRNNFPLVESAPQVVLIAGGIGITPLYGMARRLAALGRSFALYYAVREPARAAFLVSLRALGQPVHTHFDCEHAGRPLDLPAIVGAHPSGTHYYCCGPLGMLAAFETAAEKLPEGLAHVEYFKPKPQAQAASRAGFTVVLARSQRQIEIAPDQSILAALLANGVKIDSSCQDGICGTCEVRVLEGTPEHRCSVLSKAERAAGKSMMVCVSRAAGERLVLDLE